MATTVFGSTPQFVEGQILSASAHVNALQSIVQALGDDFGGAQMPFHGNGWTGGPFYQWGWTQTWRGILRHKYNYIDYEYIIENATEAYLTLNNVEIPGTRNTGPGTFSGTDISIVSLGLNLNGHYAVELRMTGMTSLIKFCEVPGPTVFPTLADFSDDDTPTAAQWQDLSDYTDMIAERMLAPRCLGMRTTNDDSPQSGPVSGYHMRGTMNHRGRYLAYNLMLHAPYWSTGCEDVEWNVNTHVRYTQARILINDVEVLWVRCGEPVFDVTWCPYFHGNGPQNRFVGTLDLATQVPTLVVGDDYDLVVICEWEGCWGDLYGSAGIYYLYEAPDIGQLPGGWRPMPEWEHGDWVRGDTETPQLAPLKANIETLGGLVQYNNYPTTVPKSEGEGLFGVRRHRWLHFRIWREHNEALPDDDENIVEDEANGFKEEKAGTIRYMYLGKEKTVSITNPYTVFGVYDLSTCEGLFVGTQYYLEGVRFALEDSEA